MGGAQTRQVGSATVSPGMPLLTTGVPRRRANSSVHGARRMRAASGARAIGDGVAKRHNCGARHGPGREARQGKRATQDTQDAQGGTGAHREGHGPTNGALTPSQRDSVRAGDTDATLMTHYGSTA
ncbi:MAG: hypothetical protein M3Y74_23495 [Chloroflexota bacterium]|nr:hypothetical protein [Chloroflexota bacterium]